ncbi:PilZ domain-containing protein [Pokkaliibacter plantistimulans]|nr:PilZ domain-containing protein [Pokkaliibacter plantistimulans]PPC74045.1 PilZ domain-containing protein [Pokkaliibacter plantistimulans]
MIGHDDRRNFYRMMINAEVVLWMANRSAPLRGVCQDLSATGMGVIVSSPLQPGEEIMVKLASQSNSLEAEARVVRCDSKGPQEYLVGLEVIRMH